MPVGRIQGDSFDNALAESINASYKAECTERLGPWRDATALEIATAKWVEFQQGLPPARPRQADAGGVRGRLLGDTQKADFARCSGPPTAFRGLQRNTEGEPPRRPLHHFTTRLASCILHLVDQPVPLTSKRRSVRRTPGRLKELHSRLRTVGPCVGPRLTSRRTTSERASSRTW